MGPGPQCQPSSRPGMNAVEKRTQYSSIASGQNHRCLHGRCIGFAVTTRASLAPALTASGPEHTFKGVEPYWTHTQGFFTRKWEADLGPQQGCGSLGIRRPHPTSSPGSGLCNDSHAHFTRLMTNTLRIFTKNSPHTKNIGLTVYTGCSHIRTPPRPQ